jgi:hypothetical protein
MMSWPGLRTAGDIGDEKCVFGLKTRGHEKELNNKNFGVDLFIMMHQQAPFL